MAFKNKKTTFSIYEIVSDMDLVQLSRIKENPIKDITNEKTVGQVYYSCLNDLDSNDIDFSNGKVISFSVVNEMKKIPKDKIDKALYEAKEKFEKENKKEMSNEEVAELRDNIVGELAIGQHATKTSCGIIIDLRERLIYAEKKGYLGDLALSKLNELCGIQVKYWTAFSKPLINNKPVKSLFMHWLYVSMEKQKIDVDSKGTELRLSNSIKLRDNDSTTFIRGNINKYIGVYKTIMNGGNVSELVVKIDEPQYDAFEYTLKDGDNLVHSFSIKNKRYNGYDDYQLSIIRIEEFNRFIAHLRQLSRIFEERIG